MKLFEEISKVLPTDQRFVFDFFSRFLLLNDKNIPQHISIRCDYLLLPIPNEDSDPEADADLLGEYRSATSISDIKAAIKAVDSFLSFLKAEGMVADFSISKLKIGDIEIEDPFDHERRELVSAGRLHAHDVAVSVNENNVPLLQTFADTYIVEQGKSELASDTRQNAVVADYVLRKYSDLAKSKIILNTGVFYGLRPLSATSVDDRQYIRPGQLQKVHLMKSLRDLSTQGFFTIASVMYAIKDSVILPRTVTIALTPSEAKRLKKNFKNKISDEKMGLKKKIKNISLNVEDCLLEINSGAEVISFRSKVGEQGLNKETAIFKTLVHLWEYRHEIKGGTILQRGDWVSLDNLARQNKTTTGAQYKNIDRLRTKFKGAGVTISIEPNNTGKYRLVIEKG